MRRRQGENQPPDPSLYDYVIYRCVIGSKAFGLDDADSDTDRRGIYLPPADLQWSLSGVPEQLGNQETEECYWELGKFLQLALKANPNALECLYTPMVEVSTPLADELLGMKQVFLSRLMGRTYGCYVGAQFRLMDRRVRQSTPIKWQHAMHLIRLLLSGITAFRDGWLPVRVNEHRDMLLAVARAELPWQEVDAWRQALQAEFENALETSALPELPDYERVNAFLVKARRSMIR